MPTFRLDFNTASLSLLPIVALLGVTACGDQSPSSQEGPSIARPIPVVGGEPAALGDYPSTVALVDPSGNSFCSGTLVSPTLVVTAAHCLEDWGGNVISPSEVRVVYGYLTPKSAPSSERRAVASVHKHPQYQPYASTDSDGMGHTNDIGALVLQAPIDNGIVAPILPAVDVEAELTPGREVHIAGYGIYNYNQQKDGTLYKAITPHVRHIQWEMLAGQPGEPDTCNGDSGGPAYLVVNGALFLTGITSRAWAKSTEPCGDGGIYTIASEYVSWLESFGGELDGGATEGGFEGGGWDATTQDAGAMLDASASCLALTNVCNPVTNEGCDESKGEACRMDSAGTSSCHVGANDQPAGALCDDTSRFCEVGYHCGESIRCEQYCCTSADCTGGGTCTPLSTSGGTLGTCGVPAKPDAAADAAAQPDSSAQDAQADATVQDGQADAGDPTQDGGEQEAGAVTEPQKRVIDGAGCGCSAPAGRSSGGALVVAALAGALVLARRRR